MRKKLKKVLTVILKLLKPFLYSRSKGKYKGKIPLIYFSCEEIGHIATRCPNKESKDEKKSHKQKRKKEFKGHKNYKVKGKKTCFMAKDW